MKKKVIILFLALAVTIVPLVSVGYIQKAEAGGIPVIDVENIMKTMMTYVEAAKTAVNTAIQITKQIQELATMSPEALLANVTGLNKQFDQIKNTIKSADGIMKTAQSAESLWKNAFGSVENFGTNNSAARLAQQTGMLHHLDKTYLDSLRVAKLSEQLEGDMENLNKSLEEVQNAQGNKHISQANAGINAQGVKQSIMTNQILSSLTSTIAAQANYERTIDNSTLADTKKSLEKLETSIPATNPLSGSRKGWL